MAVTLDSLQTATAGRPIDVITIGAALMDHLVSADFAVLEEIGFAPGSMSLVETDTVMALHEKTEVQGRVSGGAEANTAVGVSAFGGNGGFVGAVGTDDTGVQYAADLESAGVTVVLNYVPLDDPNGPQTGSSFIIVTPDAERTMLTSLGISPLIDHDNINVALLATTKVVYFSAYCLDYPGADDLVQRIIDCAHSAGTLIAFSFADPFCVDRHRDTIDSILKKDIGLVFANESEAKSFTGAADVNGALSILQERGITAVVTMGADGAMAVNEKEIFSVPADHVENVVDATGAGDLFASGVLFGITSGTDLGQAIRLGALSAGEVISHYGARPTKDLAVLAKAAGLIS